MLPVTGALTKGDRRAASGADLKEFNFDTPYGRTALKTLYNCVCQVGLDENHDSSYFMYVGVTGWLSG